MTERSGSIKNFLMVNNIMCLTANVFRFNEMWLAGETWASLSAITLDKHVLCGLWVRKEESVVLLVDFSFPVSTCLSLCDISPAVSDSRV